MKVYFTKHARKQLEKQEIEEDVVKDVLEKPDKVYYDLKEGELRSS